MKFAYSESLKQSATAYRELSSADVSTGNSEVHYLFLSAKPRENARRNQELAKLGAKYVGCAVRNNSSSSSGRGEAYSL